MGSIALGPLVIDGRSAELGLNTSTLIFTVIHSVNLMLLTTSSEDLVWTLRWFMSPLAWFGLPVDLISFQLLLALRFLPLVQEELQNLLRSLATRAINFKKLGIKGSIGIFLSLGERLLSNILLRAEQGADSLLVRNNGLILNPRTFTPEQTFNAKTIGLNFLVLAILILMLILRKKYGQL